MVVAVDPTPKVEYRILRSCSCYYFLFSCWCCLCSCSCYFSCSCSCCSFFLLLYFHTKPLFLSYCVLAEQQSITLLPTFAPPHSDANRPVPPLTGVCLREGSGVEVGPWDGYRCRRAGGEDLPALGGHAVPPYPCPNPRARHVSRHHAGPGTLWLISLITLQLLSMLSLKYYLSFMCTYSRPPSLYYTE